MRSWRSCRCVDRWLRFYDGLGKIASTESPFFDDIVRSGCLFIVMCGSALLFPGVRPVAILIGSHRQSPLPPQPPLSSDSSEH